MGKQPRQMRILTLFKNYFILEINGKEIHYVTSCSKEIFIVK